MARPQKNNCEYFPHLTTMRNHRKVKALRNKFGSVKGYAFWSMFLEYLTELDGNEFEFSPMECEMFAAELGVSAEEIPPMIDYCIEIELLFKTSTSFIYSDSLNEALKPVYDKRGREREKSKSRQRHENGVFANGNATTSGISATETPQSKVKESKEKKSKENRSKDLVCLEDSELYFSILHYFGFTEMRNPDKLRQIFTFVNILHTDHKIELFREQFEAYKAYKEKSNTAIHAFPNFLGHVDNRFVDGGWNQENWSMKLKSMDKNHTEIEETLAERNHRIRLTLEKHMNS